MAKQLAGSGNASITPEAGCHGSEIAKSAGQNGMNEHSENQKPESAGGAPLGNLNRAINGSRMPHRGIVGEFPPELISAQRQGRKYRRQLEQAFGDSEINEPDSRLIDRAAAAVVHAGVCRWLLRNKLSDMTAADVMACSREILKAKEARDRAVDQLSIHHTKAGDVADGLYGHGPGWDDSEDLPNDENAAEAESGAEVTQ